MPNLNGGLCAELCKGLSEHLKGNIVTQEQSQQSQESQESAFIFMSVFQAQNTIAQVSTGTSMPAINMGQVSDADDDYTHIALTGITTLVNAGEYLLNAHAMGRQSANNRAQVNLEIYADDGGDNNFTLVAQDKQYASRNTTQRDGSAQISNFYYKATAGTQVRVNISHVGVAPTYSADGIRTTILRLS